MRKLLVILSVFCLAEAARANCIPAYVHQYRAAKSAVPANFWPYAGIGLGVGAIARRAPLPGVALIGGSLAAITYLRYQAHLKLQPLILLTQAQTGFGAKLNSFAEQLDLEPNVLAGVIRVLDQANAFCGAGLMNEEQMREQVLIGVRPKTP